MNHPPRPQAIPGRVWVWNVSAGRWLSIVPPANNGPRFNTSIGLGLDNSNPSASNSISNFKPIYLLAGVAILYFMFKKK